MSADAAMANVGNRSYEVGGSRPRIAWARPSIARAVASEDPLEEADSKKAKVLGGVEGAVDTL